MSDHRQTRVRRTGLRRFGALVVLAGVALAACTSQASAPQAPAAVTPTASAQFVSPTAQPSASSSTSESSAAPTAAPSASPSPAVESVVTSASVEASPQESTPLGSVLPEVLNPTDPQEIADRQAVEAAWIRFWDYYPTFEELSPAERETIADSIAVDPLKQQILEGAANADANGETGYGSVTHRISWYQSVDGQPQITIADCMDQSQAGTSEKASGKKLTKGFPRENLRGDLVFEGSGWRVRNLFYQPDGEEC